MQRERDKLEPLLARARAIDSVTASHQRLRVSIEKLLAAGETDRMAWAEDNVRAIRDAMTLVARVTQHLVELRVTEWITETTRASSAAPARFNLFQRSLSPESYRIRLESIVPELLDFMNRCAQIIVKVDKSLDRLPVQSLALLVVAETITDAIQRNSLDQRARLLIQSAQSGLNTKAQVDQLRLTCAEHKRTIDQLLNVTLPNWAMARARE